MGEAVSPKSGPEDRTPRRSGSKVSMAEVAARAGVSVATVSRVLNGVRAKYSDETEARVRKAISDMDYRPTSVGRTLRQGESRLVAVLAANLANPAMAAIAASMETALREAGYVMVLCDTHDQPEIQDEHLLEMRAQFATAIVFLGAVQSPRLEDFRSTGERLLFVNRRDPFAATDPYVGIDNRLAGLEVAAFLAPAHAADIAVIHGPLTSSATEDRVSGFREGMATLASNCTLHLMSADEQDHLQIGYRAAADLLAGPGKPDAIFCLSDLIAFGAARRMREAGFEANRDYRIVGFDDTPLNDWIAPWLTSVRVPYEAFGPAIIDALNAIADGEGDVEIVLPHAIVERHGTPVGTLQG